MAKPLQRFFVNEPNDVEMKSIGACALLLEQFFTGFLPLNILLTDDCAIYLTFCYLNLFFFLGKEQPNFSMETENKPSHVVLLTGVTANYLFG